jgi:hypothetical protein
MNTSWNIPQVGLKVQPTMVILLNTHLQAFEENLLLPLQVDVLGPLNVASQVTLRLDIISNIEVTLDHLLIAC